MGNIHLKMISNILSHIGNTLLAMNMFYKVECKLCTLILTMRSLGNTTNRLRSQDILCMMHHMVGRPDLTSSVHSCTLHRCSDPHIVCIQHYKGCKQTQQQNILQHKWCIEVYQCRLDKEKCMIHIAEHWDDIGQDITSMCSQLLPGIHICCSLRDRVHSSLPQGSTCLDTMYRLWNLSKLHNPWDSQYRCHCLQLC